MPTSTPVLLSVNVGMPKDVPWQGHTVFTGVWKHPVDGPVTARRLNLDGDGQGDRAGHGGEQRAVLVYQVLSYRHWQEYFGRDDFEYGQFGENLTVDGMPDDEVCIGDRYRIGSAEFEVTQPRVTCYRVGLRMGQPDLPALLVSHRRPGFYMRVITEGEVRAGDEIVKTATGPGRLTVAETDALLYLPDRDLARVRLALQIPALSPGWQGSFRDMVEAGGEASPLGATVPRPEPAWAGFRTLTVSRVVAESDSVFSIYLAAEDGGRLPAAAGGQYLVVQIPGAGEPPPVRSYSLSSAPGAVEYRISVKREPYGLASGYLTRRAHAGEVLGAAAPRGEFVLDEAPLPVLLISAGIGVTPVLAMLHELAARGDAREVWWVHVARGPREHPLAAEAHALLGGLPAARQLVFFTAATAEERAAAGAEEGRPTAERLLALGLPVSCSAYVCGPEPFMAAMAEGLVRIGIDAARIHTERFGAMAPINPGLTDRSRPAPHQPPGPPGDGVLVTFARSGISTRFDPAWGSVLDLADACDVPTRWSCRTGVCHTCLTPLLSGRVGYAPAPLDAPGDGQVLVCCAQPQTDVVLDM